ncbi:hypothetical protein EYZ11_004451 [Aspergillus tanneri]|uniref:Uncharacterized protein n=1 Tax=Aspergillus tanneri TaxID=1220188 RepID=A0A4S3JMW1_9EURO|nr:hypothetical protein EYZ11_004451 [Aspergillus tanneri]
MTPEARKAARQAAAFSCLSDWILGKVQWMHRSLSKYTEPVWYEYSFLSGIHSGSQASVPINTHGNGNLRITAYRKLPSYTPTGGANYATMPCRADSWHGSPGDSMDD